MGSHKDKHSSKHKHRSKEKKRGRDKERKHKKEKKRRRSSSGSGSSSSDSDGGRIDVNRQLAMGRAAARAVREILAYNHELRKELRELVCTLDGGGALEVSGIPDAFLRSRLTLLLDNLVQLRRNSAGQYFKRRGAEATVLSFVAPLLEESAEQLAPYKQASQKFAEDAAAAEAAARAADAAAVAAAANGGAVAGEERAQRAASPAPAGPQVGPAGPPPQQRQEQQEGLVESEGDGSEGEAAVAAGPIGPAAGPIGPAAFPPGTNPSEQQEEGQEAEDEEEIAAGARRAAGPAMPPAEWLAAAAQMEYPVSDGEGQGAEEEEEEEDFLVGPPPPEVAEELDAASMDERTAEVARVMRVLAAHAAELAKATAAEAAERPPDAYDVLGVEHDAPAAEVKKRYWRLSLLIHPDKCDHPKAHDAFQAVAGAAKELQDAALRKKVDERRQDAELRREFAAVAAREERERQWRIAKGQATAADLAGPVAPQPVGVQRETWMTELPPEKRQPTAAVMPTAPFQGFSAKGVQSRGDTSGWTMTPQQRAAQLEGGGAGAAGAPLLLTSAAGADGGVAAANPQAAARMAAAVDAYNASGRAKSLMELHQERMAGGGDKKKRKKDKAEQGGGSSTKDGSSKGSGKAELGYDPAQHPWRPFDREKDLGPGLKARAKAEDLLKGQRALGSKFSGGQGGGRTFL